MKMVGVRDLQRRLSCLCVEEEDYEGLVHPAPPADDGVPAPFACYVVKLVWMSPHCETVVLRVIDYTHTDEVVFDYGHRTQPAGLDAVDCSFRCVCSKDDFCNFEGDDNDIRMLVDITMAMTLDTKARVEQDGAAMVGVEHYCATYVGGWSYSLDTTDVLVSVGPPVVDTVVASVFGALERVDNMFEVVKSKCWDLLEQTDAGRVDIDQDLGEPSGHPPHAPLSACASSHCV